MTTPGDEGADGLRVGGWLPVPQVERGSDWDEQERADREERRPVAHAAPDIDLDDDLDYDGYRDPYDPDLDGGREVGARRPVRKTGWGSAAGRTTPGRAAAVERAADDERATYSRHGGAAGRVFAEGRAAAGRAVEAGAAVLAGAGRYVYQGRRRFGEIISPRRRRARIAVVGMMALVAVLVVLTATLGPDGAPPQPGRDLALPSGAPPPVAATAADGLGSATPAPRPTTTAPRRTPPTSRPAPKPPPTTPAGPKPVYHEAEAALLVGTAEVMPLADASGGRIVHNLGTDQYGRAGQISFTQVTVPKATRYALTIFYVSAEQRYALLTINNQRQHQLGFPSTGDWETVGSQTFTIELAAGRNSLTFSNPYAWAPRLDRISLLG